MLKVGTVKLIYFLHLDFLFPFYCNLVLILELQKIGYVDRVWAEGHIRSWGFAQAYCSLMVSDYFAEVEVVRLIQHWFSNFNIVLFKF